MCFPNHYIQVELKVFIYWTGQTWNLDILLSSHCFSLPLSSFSMWHPLLGPTSFFLPFYFHLLSYTYLYRVFLNDVIGILIGWSSHHTSSKIRYHIWFSRWDQRVQLRVWVTTVIENSYCVIFYTYSWIYYAQVHVKMLIWLYKCFISEHIIKNFYWKKKESTVFIYWFLDTWIYLVMGGGL